MNASAAAKYDDETFTLQMLREQRYAELAEFPRMRIDQQVVAAEACRFALGRHPVPTFSNRRRASSTLLDLLFNYPPPPTSAMFSLETLQQLLGSPHYHHRETNLVQHVSEEGVWRSYFGPLPERGPVFLTGHNWTPFGLQPRLIFERHDVEKLLNNAEVKDAHRQRALATRVAACRANQSSSNGKSDVRQKHQRASKSTRKTANRSGRMAHMARKK